MGSLLMIWVAFLGSQGYESQGNSEADSVFRLVFYNVENLFDTEDDPKKRDNQFTPNGDKHWTQWKLYRKLSDISQVIRSAGGQESPDVVGLAEVENRKVLDMLLSRDALAKHNYAVVHRDAPDRRGIDVAILYKPKSFRLIDRCIVPIFFEGKPASKTRDILHISGVIRKTEDTLHIFVVHFPSRWGGVRKSEPKRKFVAKQLRQEIGFVFEKNGDSKVVVMGDFNDLPEDESVREVLGAVPIGEVPSQESPSDLINVSVDDKVPGSYIYRKKWQQLDQMIVSKAVLQDYTILFSNHLLPMVSDFRKDGTMEIRRTYKGNRYHGGVSDHLPITLRLKIRK